MQALKFLHCFTCTSGIPFYNRTTQFYSRTSSTIQFYHRTGKFWNRIDSIIDPILWCHSKQMIWAIDFLPMIFINFHFWTRKWTLCHSVPMWYDFKLPLDNWLVHARHAKTNQLSRISDPFYPGRNSRHMGSQLAVFMTRRAFRWLAAI